MNHLPLISAFIDPFDLLRWLSPAFRRAPLQDDGANPRVSATRRGHPR
jgi:hypothetical protein